jgi:hypothetical protein
MDFRLRGNDGRCEILPVSILTQCHWEYGPSGGLAVGAIVVIALLASGRL